MRYIPIVLVSVGLVGVVMAMAGDKERGVRTGLTIAVVVLGMLVMAALLALVVRRTL